MDVPFVRWITRIWIILLWIYLLTDECDGLESIRTPEVRRLGVPGSQFVNTNRLAESDGQDGPDYDSLLDRFHGDFGVRSDIVEAAGKEPEYLGSDTLVVPLYIPKGAVPINLERIPRSGTPEPNVGLDMRMSSSADSVLIRRIGPVSGPRSISARRPWRNNRNPIRLQIRRSDFGTTPPTTTTQVSPLIGGFGRRISPYAAPLISRHSHSSQKTNIEDIEDDLEDNKRAKKNELSKDSQFHGLHTTERGASSSASTSKIPTSTNSATTPAKPSSTFKFPKRRLIPTTERTSSLAPSKSSTTTSTTTETTTSSTTTTTTTTPTTTTTTPTTTTTSTTTTSTTTVIKPISSTSSSVKSSPTITTSTKMSSTTQLPPSTTPWDRRSVLFPKPVESILKIPEVERLHPKISKDDEDSSPEEDILLSTSTTRSPLPTLRILPPWLTRSNSELNTRSPLKLKISRPRLKDATTTVRSPVINSRIRPITLTVPSTNTTVTTTSTPETPTITTSTSIEKESLQTTENQTVRSTISRKIIKSTTPYSTTPSSTTPSSTTLDPTIRTTSATTPTSTTIKTTSRTTQRTTTQKPITPRVITSRGKILNTNISSTTNQKIIAPKTSFTLTALNKNATSPGWFLITTHRPTPQRSSPIKMMPSVSEILHASEKEESKENPEEVHSFSITKDTFAANLPLIEKPTKIISPEISAFIDSILRSKANVSEENSKGILHSLNIPEDKSDNDKHVSNQSDLGSKIALHLSDKEKSKDIFNSSNFDTEEKLVSEDSEPKNNENSNTETAQETFRPTITAPRKFIRRPRPIHTHMNVTNAERESSENVRPLRRRRPGRPRTSTPPPITRLSDFFKTPEETIIYNRPATRRQLSTTTIKPNISTRPTIILSGTTVHTPALTTEKSPEQVVIESLTEIMKEATSNNKSTGKDKVSNIASNLEALNKKLAERGIHIIHAEVDGVRIKLNNRTLPRHTTPPTATTFHPKTPFNVTVKTTFTTTTEKPTTVLSQPPSTSIPEKDDTNKDILTSVKSSFSIYTSNPTEIENETDSDNEVFSTTNDSEFTTFKPTEIRKLSNKPLKEDSRRPVLSTSMLPSAEEEEEDPTSSRTPGSEETLSPVLTNSPIGDREKEGGKQTESVPSIPIFATSTVPASVTTRTRSTTVPITSHRPTTTPFLYNQKDRSSKPEILNASEASSNSKSESQGSSTIHPTSHHRPNITSQKEDDSATRTTSTKDSRPKQFNYDILSYATIIEEATPPPISKEAPKPITTSGTTRRPVIEVISITKDIEDSRFTPESIATAEDVKKDDYPEASPASSSTTIYVIGVIGIIPAAGMAVYFAKRFFRKNQKALPDSEERAEGFTPITHHSRKPSHVNTLEVDTSSVEAKNPKYSPWEFPRSKLKLASILGEGNFGVVWRAEARDLCACEGAPGAKVLVAVKGVKEGAGLKEKQDLLKELAIMQQIGQHQNIVTLLGCCTQQEPYYLVMEYVMFGKLLTFLRDHRTRQNYYNFSSDAEALTSKDLTRFAYQIANGCDYLQNRGIIHRDLAARNILVDHNKVCKIADFGLARNVKDLGSDIYEQKSRGALPIRWMAPESLYMSIFTHKSDVWSLGILCWEIVTLGSTPYPGMTAREVMRQVREGYRLERPEHCRPEFYHIVTRCWHQDLNKRPTFAELKIELSTLLEDTHMAYPCIDLENFPESHYFSMNDNEDEKL